MDLKTAVGIYEKCLPLPYQGRLNCENCVLNDKHWGGDNSICSLLVQAELRAEKLKEKQP